MLPPLVPKVGVALLLVLKITHLYYCYVVIHIQHAVFLWYICVIACYKFKHPTLPLFITSFVFIMVLCCLGGNDWGGVKKIIVCILAFCPFDHVLYLLPWQWLLLYWECIFKQNLGVRHLNYWPYDLDALTLDTGSVMIKQLYIYVILTVDIASCIK